MDLTWRVPSLMEFKKEVNIQISVPDDLMPWQADLGSSGVDLKADGNHSLQPGERKLIPTGITLKMPIGCEGQIRPRSGLALKKGITVLNTPGTID